jgi:hypothetical protein
MKQLLVFKSGKDRLDCYPVDASNRRIVAEGDDEVKTFQATDHANYRRNLWFFVFRYAAIWTMSTEIPESSRSGPQPRGANNCRMTQATINPIPIHHCIRESR